MGLVFAGIVILMGVLLYIQPANVIDAFTDMLFEDNGALSCGQDHGGVCTQPGHRCINGFCKTEDPPTMPRYSDLPVRPAVSTWPSQ